MSYAGPQRPGSNQEEPEVLPPALATAEHLCVICVHSATCAAHLAARSLVAENEAQIHVSQCPHFGPWVEPDTSV